MKLNFERALARVLKHEGGYANHPADPGGATMQGVTQSTYDAYRRRQRLPQRSVRHIAQAELHAIYRSDYWDVVRGDDLPAGLDYAVFDFAVNSGPRRAARFLQRAVGAEDDGVVGPLTLRAVASADTAATIRRLCADRLAWLQQLSTWRTFGRGWERRVQEVRAHALLDVDEAPAVEAMVREGIAEGIAAAERAAKNEAPTGQPPIEAPPADEPAVPENQAPPADDRDEDDDLVDWNTPPPRHPGQRALLLAVAIGLAFLVWWLLPRGGP